MFRQGSGPRREDLIDRIQELKCHDSEQNLERAIQKAFANVNPDVKRTVLEVFDELERSFGGHRFSQAPTLPPDEEHDEDAIELCQLADDIRKAKDIIHSEGGTVNPDFLQKFDAALQLMEEELEQWSPKDNADSDKSRNPGDLPSSPVKMAENHLQHALRRLKVILDDPDTQKPVTQKVQALLCDTLELQYHDDKLKIEKARELYHKSSFIKRIDLGDSGEFQWKMYNGLRLANNLAYFEKDYDKAATLVKNLWPRDLGNIGRNWISGSINRQIVKLLKCLNDNRATENTTRIVNLIHTDTVIDRNSLSPELLEMLAIHIYETKGPDEASTYLDKGWAKIRSHPDLARMREKTVVYHISTLCQQNKIEFANNRLQFLKEYTEGGYTPASFAARLTALEAYIYMKNKGYTKAVEAARSLYERRDIHTINILPSRELHHLATLINSLAKSGAKTHSLENFEEARDCFTSIHRLCSRIRYNGNATVMDPNSRQREEDSEELYWWAEVGEDLGNAWDRAARAKAQNHLKISPAANLLALVDEILCWARELAGLDGADDEVEKEEHPKTSLPDEPLLPRARRSKSPFGSGNHPQETRSAAPAKEANASDKNGKERSSKSRRKATYYIYDNDPNSYESIATTRGSAPPSKKPSAEFKGKKILQYTSTQTRWPFGKVARGQQCPKRSESGPE